MYLNTEHFTVWSCWFRIFIMCGGRL